jgi:hypothetical protein
LSDLGVATQAAQAMTPSPIEAFAKIEIERTAAL